MRIRLALLADHTTANQGDGKLYVVGGGITSLAFDTFPAIQPHLSLALGIEVDREGFGAQHTLTIEAEGPPGAVIFKPVNVTFTTGPAQGPERSTYFHFVSNMDNVAFPSAGEYGFAVAIDGKPQERVDLRVERAGPQVAVKALTEGQSVRAVANALLSEGYAAFNRGEVDIALEKFQEAAARDPTSAPASNNLGFVYLSKGDAARSLAAFLKAQELGYPQNEISDANIACARYLDGDFAGAFQGFADCLRTRYLTTPGTLFGIGPSGLFPVQLKSAADYAALMALNAAWSAHRLSDRPATSQYLEGARAGDLTLSVDGGGRLVAESVGALEAAIQ